MISFKEIGYLGRLGNQIFQFSSTLGIARLNNTSPIFPINNIHATKATGTLDESTGKRMETKLDLLSCFDINLNFFSDIGHIKTSYVYEEKDFKYNSETENLPDYVDLFGYFQTEKYFKKNEDEIRKNLVFKEDHTNFINNYISKINEINGRRTKISVHIRRTDYLSSGGLHPLCSLNYYNQAVDIFGKEAIFLIFSDDLKWAKENFKGENFLFVEIGDPFKELCLMSKCDHHIIANSSFSWWGAWLNQKKDKKVIAPSLWFGKSMNKDTSDIYCEEWIKI